MVDVFKGYNDAPHHPARNFYAVTPDDDNDLPFVPKGLVVGVEGTVVMTGANGAADVTVTLLANLVYPYAPQRIKEASTAGGIVALH